MRKEQIKKVIKDLSVCNDVASAFTLCKDLSKYLKENLDKNIIKDIQREYINHLKQNLTNINQYISSQLVYNLNASPETYSNNICRKKLIEHSILFFNSNNFIDDEFGDKNDELIFNLIKGSFNKINDKSIERYNHGHSRILHKFGAILEYDVEIHKEFSTAMISFFKENINNYSKRLKEQANLILHSLIVYCGDKIDYNRMVFSESLFSEEERGQLIRIGDILSFDKEYYKNRFLGIKRRSGYMDKREAILRHSLDSGLLDTELAELAGKLSKNNAYYISRYLIRGSGLDKDKISSYARTLIMTSKHHTVYSVLYNKISKQDFIMCLPIFSQCFSENPYFERECKILLENYQSE